MELKLTNISKNYGKYTALENTDLKLTSGIYGLLGENGAGKSTLIKQICGLQTPTTGMVTYDFGYGIKEDNAYQKYLGYLPQEFRYYPYFTGEEFLIYMSKLKGASSKKAKSEAKYWLNEVNLTEKSHEKIKSYSGGMKQRLGIAQALLNNPKILIFDEPTVGLDPKERAKFRNLLSELSKLRIILLSTHIISDVDLIAEKLIMMSKGKITCVGKIDSLLSELRHTVWELVVEESELDYYMNVYQVIRYKKIDNRFIKIRLFNTSQPMSTARVVTPELEDLYISHTKEYSKC